MPIKNIPTVSIIIPMYNTEKYIGECLDSILAQTFTDFEVIVVDDCSTDKSCEVVESFIPKFGGRLQLIRSKKNSGGCNSIPRNHGIRLSCGEYIWFIDSDDVIFENALEEFNSIIEKFDVDVLYFTKYYQNTGEFSLKDKSGLKEYSTDEITEPVLMSDNLQDRMDKFCEKKYIPFSWDQIFRRTFILENNITFPNVRCGTDYFFGLCALCLAKKVLGVPNLWYVWRQTNMNSITKQKLPVDKLIHRWTDSLFKGVGIIDKFTNEIAFFSEHPEYKHRLYELMIDYHTNKAIRLYSQIPAWQLEPLIRRELGEVEDKTALTAFLFSRMNVFNVQMSRQNQTIRQLMSQLQK